jgi:Uma2 family endonuclease
MIQSLHLSLDEYDHMVQVGAFDNLGRKIELIHGELIEMNPAGPLHDDLITYLNDWSADHRDRNQTVITSQTGLNLPEQVSRPEPDLMWLRKSRYQTSHPTASDVQLAIEVSYSSLAYDLERKRLLYAAAGIIEYWIVDAAAKCIHVHRDHKSGDYQSRRVFQAPQTLSPLICPAAVLDIADLFQ